jgi:hypothetical protein
MGKTYNTYQAWFTRQSFSNGVLIDSQFSTAKKAGTQPLPWIMSFVVCKLIFSLSLEGYL